MSPRPITVTILTPPGRGAVASVSVKGPQAVDLVESRFSAASGKHLAELPLRRIVFGRWNASAGPGEDLVVCRLAEEQVEVHCHGGAAAVEAVVASLVEAGAKRQTTEDWTAVHEGDLIVAEARLALSEAKTERTALILLDQYHGALRRELEAIAELLQNMQNSVAQARIERLLATHSLGMHLTRPWRVAIAGRPNAGKSSLMNALLGYTRSIVFEQPGTTRDAVKAITAFDGWPVELTDTAGLRATEDPVELAGILLAEEVIQRADLVVYVHDATQPWDQHCITLAGLQRLIVYSKTDLCREAVSQRRVVEGNHPVSEGSVLQDSSEVWTSVVTGAGIAELIAEITRRLVPQSPQRGEPVLFTARQVNFLRDYLPVGGGDLLLQFLRARASGPSTA